MEPAPQTELLDGGQPVVHPAADQNVNGEFVRGGHHLQAANQLTRPATQPTGRSQRRGEEHHTNTSLLVRAWGGGGGGGGGTNSGFGAGGGGGGAYAYTAAVPVTACTGYTVTVGAAGPGGSAGNDGNNGGKSLFQQDTTLSAGGGSGGAKGAGGGGSGETVANSAGA
ncbi:MAG: glycine-rich domain-containing protein, partial [Candidatus Nanopelagicales bacterium]